MENKSIKLILGSILIGGCFIGSYKYSKDVVIPREEARASSSVYNSNYNKYYSEDDFLDMENVTHRYIYNVISSLVITNNTDSSDVIEFTEQTYYHIKNSELYMNDDIVKENIDRIGYKNFSNIENFFNYLSEKVEAENVIFIKKDDDKLDYVKMMLDLSL